MPSQATTDKISDFSAKHDAIWLGNNVVTKLGSKGSEGFPAQLSKSYFIIGSKDKNDYIVCAKAKGVLYNDQGGSRAQYK